MIAFDKVIFPRIISATILKSKVSLHANLIVRFLHKYYLNSNYE